MARGREGVGNVIRTTVSHRHNIVTGRLGREISVARRAVQTTLTGSPLKRYWPSSPVVASSVTVHSDPPLPAS